MSKSPEEIISELRELSSDDLSNMGEAVRQVQLERALAQDDPEAIIANAFDEGFDRGDLAVLPWVHGQVVVCPGAIVNRSKTNHKCSFVSVDDTWVWDSTLLIREDKRSLPGRNAGFKAVALVALVDGTELDVVYGKARSGVHSVTRVVSYEIQHGALVEVSQRDIKTPAL